MANYEIKPGEFTLFKNSKKTESKHPDVNGPGLNLDGQKISVAGWIARDKNGAVIKDKNGNTILNCRMQLDYDKAEAKPQKAEFKADDIEDGMPF